MSGWVLLAAGVLIGAGIAGCGVAYLLRDRLTLHAAPAPRREPARHAAAARRVITRAPTAAEPPQEFLEIPSYPPPPDLPPAPYVAAEADTAVHPAIPAEGTRT